MVLISDPGRAVRRAIEAVSGWFRALGISYANQHGEVAERSIAAVLKTVVPIPRDRGFESLSLREAVVGAGVRAKCGCGSLKFDHFFAGHLFPIFGK